jgi:hypothetical protein
MSKGGHVDKNALGSSLPLLSQRHVYIYSILTQRLTAIIRQKNPIVTLVLEERE